MTINDLREQIRKYDQLYRDGKAVISDTEYDKLFSTLKRLEAESGEPIPADSPTQYVGTDRASNKEAAHTIPMLSIENVYSTGELNEFGNRVAKALNKANASWVVELKIDGVSLALIYENGKIVQGITRGNGIVGNDITHNLDIIVDIPKTIPYKKRLEVRGEVYMLNSDLSKLNEDQQRRGDKIYKNARNITTGTISLKDPDEEPDKKKKQEILLEHKRRTLRFFAHSVGSDEGIKADTHWGFLQELKDYGIPAAPHTQRFETFAQAAAYCESLYSGEENFLSELDFEIDGLVLKVNDFSLRKQLGSTGHHPRWVVAYKVEKYEASTTVREIRVQVGKQGTVTPVAELEPVEIAGTTVSRATLHNAEEMNRLDIQIGDTVIVEKAGKIIPHIIRVEKHLRKSNTEPFVFPTECPVCNSPLTKDAGGVFIRCRNAQCPAQFKEKLKFFAGRSAMDIEGLGIQLIEQLVDSGLVKNFGDLYRLSWEKIRPKELERMKAKPKKPNEVPTLVQNLLDGIAKSKNRELRYFISALSIPGIGTSTARDLAQHFGTLDKLRSAAEAELADIENIGETTAKNIVEYFRNEKEMLDDLLALMGDGIQQTADSGQHTADGGQQTAGVKPLAGMTIVVTGTLEHFKRTEIEDVIERHGGRASGSVSSKTTFVLVGADPGSKLDKARKLGVRIVNEAEFEKMIQ